MRFQWIIKSLFVVKELDEELCYNPPVIHECDKVLYRVFTKKERSTIIKESIKNLLDNCKIHNSLKNQNKTEESPIADKYWR